MKKSYWISIIVLLALVVTVTTAEAGKKTPAKSMASSASISWFGTYGMIGYNATTLYGSTLDFPYQQIGFYTISGNTFVGQAVALTNISGTCFNNRKDENILFSGDLNVDGRYGVPLFYTHDFTDSFNITVSGQVFTIRINIGSASAIGCNFLFESK